MKVWMCKSSSLRRDKVDIELFRTRAAAYEYAIARHPWCRVAAGRSFEREEPALLLRSAGGCFVSIEEAIPRAESRGAIAEWRKVHDWFVKARGLSDEDCRAYWKRTLTEKQFKETA